MTRRAAAPASRRPASRRLASAPRCARADDIWPYLDGELAPARARAVAAHIAGCASCGSVARRLSAMLEECRSAGCRALPADVRARARQRVKALLRAS
ncbi:MAG: zf-HC2 domain-containing protein [Vicinamibacterales bacterium]